MQRSGVGDDERCEAIRHRRVAATGPLPVVGALQAEPFVNRGFVQTYPFDGGRCHDLHPVQAADDSAGSEIHVHKAGGVKMDVVLPSITGP